MRPNDPPEEDAWFWTAEWQAKEREADEELAAGRRQNFDSGEEFLAWLDQSAADSPGNDEATGGDPETRDDTKGM